MAVPPSPGLDAWAGPTPGAGADAQAQVRRFTNAVRFLHDPWPALQRHWTALEHLLEAEEPEHLDPESEDVLLASAWARGREALVRVAAGLNPIGSGLRARTLALRVPGVAEDPRVVMRLTGFADHPVRDVLRVPDALRVHSSTAGWAGRWVRLAEDDPQEAAALLDGADGALDLPARLGRRHARALDAAGWRQLVTGGGARVQRPEVVDTAVRVWMARHADLLRTALSATQQAELLHHAPRPMRLALLGALGRGDAAQISRRPSLPRDPGGTPGR